MSGRRRPRANVWRQIDQMVARHRLEERRVRKALKRRKLDGPRLDEHGRWWCDDLQLCARTGDELLRKVDDVLKLPGMDVTDGVAGERHLSGQHAPRRRGSAEKVKKPEGPRGPK